jgi:hypothetical protein
MEFLEWEQHIESLDVWRAFKRGNKHHLGIVSRAGGAEAAPTAGLSSTCDRLGEDAEQSLRSAVVNFLEPAPKVYSPPSDPAVKIAGHGSNVLNSHAFVNIVPQWKNLTDRLVPQL